MACPAGAVSKGDLHIYQGGDFAAAVTVSNEDGTPADITGYTAKAQLRRDVADNDPVVACEITCVVQSPDVLLSIHQDMTKLLNGRYVWDLDLTSPASAVTPVMAGSAIVTSEVTRL